MNYFDMKILLHVLYSRKGPFYSIGSVSFEHKFADTYTSARNVGKIISTLSVKLHRHCFRIACNTNVSGRRLLR